MASYGAINNRTSSDNPQETPNSLSVGISDINLNSVFRTSPTSLSDVASGDYNNTDRIKILEKELKSCNRNSYLSASLLPTWQSTLQAVLLCAWDNIIGPKILFAWKRDKTVDVSPANEAKDKRQTIQNITSAELLERIVKEYCNHDVPASPSKEKQNVSASCPEKNCATSSVLNINSHNEQTVHSNSIQLEDAIRYAVGHTLHGELNRVCVRGSLEDELFIVAGHGFVVSSTTFGAWDSKQDLIVPHCIAVIIPYIQLKYFLSLRHVWTARINRLVRQTKALLEKNGFSFPVLSHLTKQLIDLSVLLGSLKPPDDQE